MRSIYLVIVLALSGAALACSFENRSSAYECPIGNECQGDRVCQEGWCVVGTAVGNDASIDAPPADAFVCPSECSSCVQDRCIIDCEDQGSCSDIVTCPAGIVCRVNCNGEESCAMGVDCSQSSECDVVCDGQQSCGQRIDCGAGPCKVSCDGQSSCAGGLDCSNSCDCESSCPGGGCSNHLCPGNSACTKADGCSNNAASCSTCF